MGEGFCWLIISLTFVVATGVTVIISVFSLPAGSGEISARTYCTTRRKPWNSSPVGMFQSYNYLMRRPQERFYPFGAVTNGSKF